MTSLTGQLLVAMPQMTDPRFERSVVYLCAHSEGEGAMGLVVNKLLASLTMDELLTHLQLEPSAPVRAHPVHFGGPVEPGRGFVLHSADYREAATLVVGDEIAITATLDDPARDRQGRRAAPEPLGARLCRLGAGPARCRDPGQWLALGPGRFDLVFDGELDDKWQRALAKLGVDLTMLSSDAGHARPRAARLRARRRPTAGLRPPRGSAAAPPDGPPSCVPRMRRWWRRLNVVVRQRCVTPAAFQNAVSSRPIVFGRRRRARPRPRSRPRPGRARPPRVSPRSLSKAASAPRPADRRSGIQPSP